MKKLILIVLSCTALLAACEGGRKPFERKVLVHYTGGYRPDDTLNVAMYSLDDLHIVYDTNELRSGNNRIASGVESFSIIPVQEINRGQ